MGIVTRHIVWETAKTLAIALFALSLLLSFGMAGKEAVRFGMPPGVFLKALPYFFVEMMGYSLPAAVLFAVCSSYGRFAADNELTALKSLGINPVQVIEPVLAAAFALALLTVVSFDATATWSRPGVKKLLANSAAEMAVGVLRTQGSVSLPGGAISVRRVDGNRLVQPCLQVSMPDSGKEALLTAELGELQSDENGIRMVLLDIHAEGNPFGQVAHPGYMQFEFPNTASKRKIHRDWLATSEIAGCIADLQQQRHALLANMPSEEMPEAHALAQGDLSSMNWKIARLSAEPHRRWANGFTCFAFALIGIAMSMERKSSDVLSTFFVAFAPVLVVFYPLLMVSEGLATSGDYPVWLFWMADVVLLVIGAVLLRRSLRR